MFDDEIVTKWNQEALATDGMDMTQEMFDWCIKELRIKAVIFQKSGMVTAYDADVVKSDSAVSEELRNALINAVKPLEDVPPHQRDWHPGSDETVLDLVHPSLFPLVYGVSRILTDSVTSLEDCIERCCEGVVCNVFRDKGSKKSEKSNSIRSHFRYREVIPIVGYSNNFQWLPCDVDISGDRARLVNVSLFPYFFSIDAQDHELYKQPPSTAPQGSILCYRTDYRLLNSAMEHHTYATNLAFQAR